MLDLTQKKDAHIDERLRSNIIVWFTTVRADGRPRGVIETPPVVAVAPLQPALASIPNACRYLGGLSRSRLYELMPHLDVVKFGARTFVTIESLDRLIATNRRPEAEQTKNPSAPQQQHRQAAAAE